MTGKKKYAAIIIIFMIFSCNKNKSESSVDNVADQDPRSLIDTTRTVLTSLFSQSDAPNIQYGIIKAFDNRWFGNGSGHPLLYWAQKHLADGKGKFKQSYGVLSFLRFRLIDSKGLVHAQYEPNIPPYGGFRYSDIYYQTDAKTDGDPSQTLKNIMISSLSSDNPGYEISGDNPNVYYDNPNAFVHYHLLQPLERQIFQSWDYKTKDTWGKYAIKTSDSSRSDDDWVHVGTIPELLSRKLLKPGLKNVYIEQIFAAISLL